MGRDRASGPGFPLENFRLRGFPAQPDHLDGSTSTDRHRRFIRKGRRDATAILADLEGAEPWSP